MATPFSVTISMEQPTVEKLTQQNQHLLAFKAVAASDPDGGLPVVWFATDVFGLNTFISWNESFQAYTSISQIVPRGRIVASNPYDIDLGQVLEVTSDAGTGVVKNEGIAEWISIENQVMKSFTCGVSMESAETQGPPVFAPICAFPLNGKSTVALQPVSKLLLVFAQEPVNTGTVIERSTSEGLLLTFGGMNDRTVKYDIDKGWDWGGEIWGQPIPSGDITKALIQQGSTPRLTAGRQ